MDELEMLKELDKLINDTPDLNTVLEETGAPIESLTAQADELQAEYDALSEKLALNVSDPLPLRWEKLLRLHSAGNQDAIIAFVFLRIGQLASGTAIPIMGPP